MTDHPTLTNRGASWILTHDGMGPFLESPQPIDIRPTDIAHALGNLCRYTGHCDPFYSVAEHCVLVADLAPDSLRAWALLHDAPEAYLGDVASPLKRLLQPAYGRLEEAWEEAIRVRFGLRRLSPEQQEAIRDADHAALEIERSYLLPPHPKWKVPRRSWPLQLLRPQAASKRWLEELEKALAAVGR